MACMDEIPPRVRAAADDGRTTIVLGQAPSTTTLNPGQEAGPFYYECDHLVTYTIVGEAPGTTGFFYRLEYDDDGHPKPDGWKPVRFVSGSRNPRARGTHHKIRMPDATTQNFRIQFAKNFNFNYGR